MEFSRESRIRRDREGRWFDGGVEITHPGIVRAFDRWIDRAEDGRYILKNAIDWAYVDIEGAPIFVRHIRLIEDGVELILSDETAERLDPKTLRLEEDGVLGCDVRRGRMPARFTRRAQLEVEPILGEDAAGLYLLVGKQRFRLS